MPRTTTVHLLTGDYPDRLADLATAARAALDDESPRAMLDQHPYEALAEQHKALRAEAIEAGTTVNLAALGRTTWRNLKEKHPPRTEGDEDTIRGDRLAGVDTDAVEDDLVFESMKAWRDYADEKVPEVSSRAAFEEWADKLSEGEWQVLVMRAWELTNGARLDPKDLPSLPTPSDG
jgi:hypothetical protein